MLTTNSTGVPTVVTASSTLGRIRSKSLRSMVFDEQKRFFTAAVLNQGKGVGLDPRAITFVYEYNARMYVNMGSLIKKEQII